MTVKRVHTGKSLAVLMAKNRVKNKDLAEYLGCSSSQITRMKYCRLCRQDQLNKLCRFFNLNASEFIAEGEEE